MVTIGIDTTRQHSRVRTFTNDPRHHRRLVARASFQGPNRQFGIEDRPKSRRESVGISRRSSGCRRPARSRAHLNSGKREA